MTQTNYLCKVIRTLKGIKTVHWKMVTPLKIEKKMLKAIQKLPQLENLHLHFGHGITRLAIAPRFNLSLKTISLVEPQGRCTKIAEVRLVSDDIHSFLASCPFVETLNIASVLHYPVKFSDVVKDLPHQHNFHPSLTSLRLRNVILSPSPTDVKYLANLQSLDIRQCDENIWTAFRLSGIRLKTLEISQVTLQLVEYLLHYRGLEEFYFIAQHDLSKANPEAKYRLFQSVLPHHQDCLRAFHIQLHCGWLHIPENVHLANTWCLDDTQICCLRGLPHLKTLGVSFFGDHPPAPGKGILVTLEEALNAILSFTNQLETVYLNAVAVVQPGIRGRVVNLPEIVRMLRNEIASLESSSSHSSSARKELDLIIQAGLSPAWGTRLVQYNMKTNLWGDAVNAPGESRLIEFMPLLKH
ncbi:hypothetical protein EST38_g6859 [Candolleomyces aberdarensis]|uniref:Uncharacterized protein n=1 Tax=Candolleomyces aberdarensis TaxID=2316362 RepID=A0A4Q2DGM4_9AGAR|nr:hypothetical protein EST38_g6859 [Candolleomyces aberdarensis]